jgi:hypothetical protein
MELIRRSSGNTAFSAVRDESSAFFVGSVRVSRRRGEGEGRSSQKKS